MVFSTLLFRQSLSLLPPDCCRCLASINGSRDVCRSGRRAKVCFRPISQAEPTHGFDIRQAPTIDACSAGTLFCCAISAATYCAVNSNASCRSIARSSIGSILTLVCLVGNVKAEATQQIIEGPARVIDGDTLEVSSCSILSTHAESPTVTQLHRSGHPCRCLESASAYLVWTPQRRPNHAVTRMAGPTPVVRVSAHAVLLSTLQSIGHPMLTSTRPRCFPHDRRQHI